MMFKSIRPADEPEKRKSVATTRRDRQGTFGMTMECLSVQKWGTEHCYQCDLRDTRSCGGKRIRETGRNANGYEVPVGKEKR